MFKQIRNVIARIIQATGDVISTPPVGHVLQAPKTQAGKVSSVSVDTNLQPLHSQPASKSTKRKPSVAKPTTAVKSRKAVPKPAQTTSGKPGRPRKTVV
jgi:hypothetical protein